MCHNVVVCKRDNERSRPSCRLPPSVWISPNTGSRCTASTPAARSAAGKADIGQWKAGNYGLVSTAEDYFRFEQMLINGGTLNGVRILGPRTVAYMTSDQIGPIRGPFYGPGPGYGFGLGFAVRLTEGQAPYAGTVGDYGWQGTAGTIFWVDPKEDQTATLMVQRVGSFVHNSQLTRALVYQALN